MKHPAYQLRTNKSVDRLLFADILRKLDLNCRDYTYYSLGGPFLEDLRVMDHFFPEMRLVSLESNKQTYKRQVFNKFSSRLELLNTTLADFLLHEYSPATKDIFWLDYTDLTYRRLEEFQTVLTKVLPDSVVRITLRAEPEITLTSIQDSISAEELERLKTLLTKDFNERFDKFLSRPVDGDTFTKLSLFPQLIQGIIKIAASQALDKIGSAVDFIPVQTTCYDDGTQMISVTGVICNRNDIEATRDKFSSILFPNLDWHNPDRIDIPALSLKERLCLEPYIPVTPDQDAGEELYKILDYMIDNTTMKSKQQLSHYAACHRNYPNYLRVSF